MIPRASSPRLIQWLAIAAVLAAGCAGSRPEPRSAYSTAAVDAAREAGASFDSLPSEPLAKQVATLETIREHVVNVWRDTPAINPGGTVNALVEVSFGSRDKFEYDIETNAMKLDRVLDESVGGYPINYGCMPQTFSWDGDPFDVVVLGPPLESGIVVRGAVVDIYHMVDEKGFDPHLVISPLDEDDDPIYTLNEAMRTEIATFVDRYKKPEADQGKWARFVGWGDRDEARRFVKMTYTFFEEARFRQIEALESQ